MKHLLNNFTITHLTSIFFFACVYYYFLGNLDENFIINKELTPAFYTDNRFLHAFYISLNLETSTGYIDVIVKNIYLKTIMICQLITTLLITFNALRILLIR